MSHFCKYLIVTLYVAGLLCGCGRKFIEPTPPADSSPPRAAIAASDALDKIVAVQKVGSGRIDLTAVISLDQKSSAPALRVVSGRGKNNLVEISPVIWTPIPLADLESIAYSFDLPADMGYAKSAPYVRLTVDLDGDGQFTETLLIEPVYLNGNVTVRESAERTREVSAQESFPRSVPIAVVILTRTPACVYSLSKVSRATPGAANGLAVVTRMLSIDAIAGRFPNAKILNLALAIGSTRDVVTAEKSALVRSFNYRTRDKTTRHVFPALGDS